MEALIRDVTQSAQSFVRNVGTYLTGKGLVTTGAITAAFFAGAGSMPAMFVALAGGAALSGYLRVRDMRYNQDQMVKLYRSEIADQLDIDPKAVTRSHLHMLAYGNEDKGISPNPVIRQEIEREWNKTWLKFGTSLVAATAGFLLVMAGAPALAGSTILAPLGETMGAWMGTASIALVTGATGLILNTGLDIVVQSATTLGKQTIHDRIARIEREVERGRAVAPEQVFALFVANSARLSTSISTQYAKSYDVLPIGDKIKLMDTAGATPLMTKLAHAINTQQLPAGAMAFVLSGQRHVELDESIGTPPISVAAEKAVQMQPEQQQPRTSFVDRVVRPEANQELSHTNREDMRRQTAMMDTLAAR